MLSLEAKLLFFRLLKMQVWNHMRVN